MLKRGSQARLCCRRKVKTNMAKMWQKVYDQNYHKSLDHRSFYFKQVSFPCICNINCPAPATCRQICLFQAQASVLGPSTVFRLPLSA